MTDSLLTVESTPALRSATEVALERVAVTLARPPRWEVGFEDLRPPARFVEMLTAFDPLLRIVWSWMGQRWMIERKLSRGSYNARPIPEGIPRYQDRARRVQDGYVEVMCIMPSWPGARPDLEEDPGVPLDERVLIHLAQTDLWRLGGAAGYCDRLEAQEEREEETQLRQDRSEMHDAGKDAWQDWCWLRGHRVGMALRDIDPARLSRPGLREVMVYR